MALQRVLIANRGEIAVRIARTLHKMGRTAVGLYSEVDQDSAHVRVMDEAYLLGPAPAAQSYLNAARILEIAQQHRCDAVMPGYGFLSERASFARQCAEAGVTFVGPSPEAIDSMGSKVESRKLMIAAGVPVVPGRDAHTVEEALVSADALGYPVMLKASAGGGGKGMRLLANAEDLRRGFDRARGEAEKAFGDGMLYLEKALLNPKHVEVQLLGDLHGNRVHLFNRDCSVQRRHQKVIEEAPCSHLNADLREEMFRVALRIADAVNYHSAGTVEFLVSGSDFYFLEMNTRLQVEHPVTELITGIDLVEQMIRVAEGEPLAFAQSDLHARGAALECRIYAEDPARQYLPSPGAILKMKHALGPGVREDSGVDEGDTVTPYYDPLLSKLCTWGATRVEAREQMQRALAEYAISGIATNLDLHERLLRHPDFCAGTYGTELLSGGVPERSWQYDKARVATLCALIAHHQTRSPALTPNPLTAWQRQRREE